jgi:uncharacterized protein (TIGR02646 family)
VTPLIRPPAPPVLALDAARGWTARFVAGADFAWPDVDKLPLNQHLLPHFAAMLAPEHGGPEQVCAYCNAWPLKPTTIDHFRAKAHRRDLAFAWTNLFLACGDCQKRGDRPAPHEPEWALLIAPDELDYQFERYFDYVERDGTLAPRADAPQADRERAEATIRLFRLNEFGLPRLRATAMRRLRADNPNEFEAFPFLRPLAA